MEKEMTLFPQHKKSKLSIHELTFIALMSAILGISAQIAVPLGPISFTMQTAAFIGVVLLLDRRSALICVTVYLLLGLVGLPVFSHGRAGLGILAGPSGGFLFGFYPGILLARLILGKATQAPLWRVYLASTVAVYTTFVVGTLQYALLLGVTVQQAFVTAALPFLLIDAVKIALCTPLFWKVKHMLHQQFPLYF